MELLYQLEKLRTPVGDALMLAITQLGDEAVFLAVTLAVYWCISKRWGYYLLTVGYLGAISNQFLKLAFRVPRPWVLDGQFTIVEAARGSATGYSFPSGHSQSGVGTFGALAKVTRRRWLRWLFAAVAVAVPVSRMYLGVHTPLDVSVGAGMALILVFVLYPITKEGNGWMKWLFPVMIGFGLAFVLYAQFFPFPADMDKENLTHGLKNAWTLLGAVCGMAIVYRVEERYIQFPTKAVWWVQIVKIVGGLALVLAVKGVLKAPMHALFGVNIGDAVRYFLVVLAAGLVWPLVFRKFGGKTT